MLASSLADLSRKSDSEKLNENVHSLLGSMMSLKGLESLKKVGPKNLQNFHLQVVDTLKTQIRLDEERKAADDFPAMEDLLSSLKDHGL